MDAPFLIALAQVSPVFIDRDATVAKACAIIREAAARGAKLVVFPEAFVPCYPFWVWHVAAAIRARFASCTRNCSTTP